MVRELTVCKLDITMLEPYSVASKAVDSVNLNNLPVPVFVPNFH